LNFTTIVVIIVGVRGGRNNKGEKQLLIAMEKVNLIKMFFILGNNLEQNMKSLLKHIMRSMCYGPDQNYGNNINI
jgi:hypothetical protein